MNASLITKAQTPSLRHKKNPLYLVKRILETVRITEHYAYIAELAQHIVRASKVWAIETQRSRKSWELILAKSGVMFVDVYFWVWLSAQAGKILPTGLL